MERHHPNSIITPGTGPTTEHQPVTRLWFVLIPRFNMFALTGLLEPGRIANYLSPVPLYEQNFVSFDGKVITASNGMTIDCAVPPEKINRNDMVFVVGSWGAEHYDNPKVLSWIRLQSRNGVRLCAVEMASYILARAGLLAGKLVTTHWSYLAGFHEQYPNVFATEQLFTEDGQLSSCSGGNSGVDLMLHLIQKDHGAALAGEISDQIMHHPVRPANAPQRKTLGRGLETLELGVRAAIDLIESNISEPPSVPDIARTIGVSQRQLERQFNKAVGCTVVQFGLLLRLQHSRVLLISTDLGIREIATASGFNSLSHFAYAFKKCFGRRPSEYRQAWPEQDTTPHWPGTLSKFLDALKAKNDIKLLKK